MNFLTFSKQITSFPYTLLPSIENLNEPVSLARSSNASLWREMKIDVLPLSLKCPSTPLARWGSLIKPQKIRGHQAAHMYDQKKGSENRKHIPLCKVDL